MTVPVTVNTKRYSATERVFVCAWCDTLNTSSRSDALTCSGRCRVALHRHPERLRALQAACRSTDASAALVLDCNAVQRLRPDLLPALIAGTLTLEAVRDDVYLAYIRRVMDAAAAASSAPEPRP